MNLNEIGVLIQSKYPQAKQIVITVTKEFNSRTGSFHAFEDFEVQDQQGNTITVDFPGISLYTDFDGHFSNDNYIDDVEWDDDDEEGTLTFDLNFNLVEAA